MEQKIDLVTNKKNTYFDLKIEWPKIYKKVYERDWFKAIALFYYTFSFDFKGDTDYKSRPIIKTTSMCTEDDDETRQVLIGANSPDNPEWWITPHDCYMINGVFMYLVMTYAGYKIKIYQGINHIFLRDDNLVIVDLYWQPLDIINTTMANEEYNEGMEIMPLDLWLNLDVLRFMIHDPMLYFIFTDSLINLNTMNDHVKKMLSSLN